MKRTIATFLCALCANAPAIELRMTPAEASACQREDGCTVISQALLNQMLEQARQRGMATCESRI